jgi:hypothetical protein
VPNAQAIIDDILDHLVEDHEMREPPVERGHVRLVDDDSFAFSAYDVQQTSGKPGPAMTTSGMRYIDGRQQGEYNSTFLPATARGLYWDHGKYWQWWRASGTFSGALDDIVQALSSGQFVFEYPVEIPDWLKQPARRRLAYLGTAWPERWRQRVAKEVVYSNVSGFIWHEKVWVPDGSSGMLDIRWRWPHQVERWVLEDDNGDLPLGVKPYSTQEVIPWSKIHHYAKDAYGDDLEGVSALRRVGLLIQLKQDLLRVFAVASTVYGVPWAFIESQTPDAQPDAGDDARMVSIIGAGQAAKRPILKLKNGYTVNFTSPGSSFPPVMEMIRYLDEQIMQILAADGVLLGHRTVGSYALAEAKDSKSLRQARFWGDEAAAYINKLIPEALGYAFDVPEILPGMYPVCRFDLGSEDDRWEFPDLMNAVREGILSREDPDVQVRVREHFSLPPLEEDAPDEAPAEAASAEDVAKTALNGAQVTSLVTIAGAIKEGTLTPVQAKAIIVASFPIDEATADIIAGTKVGEPKPLPAVAEQAGGEP